MRGVPARTMPPRPSRSGHISHEATVSPLCIVRGTLRSITNLGGIPGFPERSGDHVICSVAAERAERAILYLPFEADLGTEILCVSFGPPQPDHPFGHE